MPLIWAGILIGGLFVGKGFLEKWGDAAEKTGKYVLLPVAVFYAVVTIVALKQRKQ